MDKKKLKLDTSDMLGFRLTASGHQAIGGKVGEKQPYSPEKHVFIGAKVGRKCD